MMFESLKLKENAINSIRLGLEDFKLSQKDSLNGGDPNRTLSAVRNLYAGMLLLFKFRITQQASNDQEAVTLIFNPPEVLPQKDSSGGVEWKPVGKFKKTTIDLATIKKRFSGFDINVDWTAIDKLQSERNELEHLHPSNAVGVITTFVADLFPVLRDFISNELEEAPAVLLGEAWTIMLEHHAFFNATLTECKAAWGQVNIPEKMEAVLDSCICPNCASSLLMPSNDDDDINSDLEDTRHKYKCIGCDYSDSSITLLEETLVEFLGGHNPYDGEEPPTDNCPNCLHDTFVHSEGECFWCKDTLSHYECAICGEGLSLAEQENNGLCNYHQYVADKEYDK